MKKLEGKLSTFYETGMDGIAMVLEDNEKNGYESIHFLSKGDALIVYDGKSVYWSGNIDEKMEELYSEIYKTGSRDEKWLDMFYKKMRAELIKYERNKNENKPASK